MARMHENELDIDKTLVTQLIKNQCPQWGDLPITPILSSGTDNALFRLGTDYVVRLPRIEWSPGSVVKSVNQEYEWIPKVASVLKVPVSEPLFKGKPDNTYPWPWMITRWNDGHNPPFENEHEYEQLAIDLALFLNELHSINLKDGPRSRRGIPLNSPALDAETRRALQQLNNEIDVAAATPLWDQLSQLPYWSQPPVWVHGDFLPGNILVQNDRLSAVIDFADLGQGDPACDLVIAWSLLNPNSRQIFKNNLLFIDDYTWERGRGWALSIAVIMLPYYKNTNPTLATLARRMVNHVLND